MEGKAAMVSSVDINAELKVIETCRATIEAAKQRSEIAARRIFTALDNGQTTGDEVRDAVLRESRGYPDRALEAKYLEVLALLKGNVGQYILVILAREEHPHGCSPSRESWLDFTVKVGVLAGENFLFGPPLDYRVGFPTGGRHLVIEKDRSEDKGRIEKKDLDLGGRYSFTGATIGHLNDPVAVGSAFQRSYLRPQDAFRLRIIVGNNKVLDWFEEFDFGKYLTLFQAHEEELRGEPLKEEPPTPKEGSAPAGEAL